MISFLTFDEISSIKKVNNDTFDLSFKCRKNKSSVFFYPEFKFVLYDTLGIQAGGEGVIL